MRPSTASGQYVDGSRLLGQQGSVAHRRYQHGRLEAYAVGYRRGGQRDQSLVVFVDQPVDHAQIGERTRIRALGPVQNERPLAPGIVAGKPTSIPRVLLTRKLSPCYGRSAINLRPYAGWPAHIDEPPAREAALVLEVPDGHVAAGSPPEGAVEVGAVAAEHPYLG